MEDRKKLLKYLKDKDIARKYQIIFDRLFNYESLELITDKEASKIMCENEYESIIRLYEVVNNVKLDEDIKNYIYSLNKPEVIKYSLRLLVSKDFHDDEKKKEYIYALSESCEESIRYAYGIASSKAYINKEDGIEFVKEIGSCNEYIALNLINIVHSEHFINDKNLLKFIKMVKDIEDESIIEYIRCLFENEYFSRERMSLDNMIEILESKQKVMKKSKK